MDELLYLQESFEIELEQLIDTENQLHIDYMASKKYADEIYARASKVKAELDKVQAQILDMLKSIRNSDGVVAQETPQYRIALYKSKPKVITPSLDAVPDEFVRIKREPDREKIKKWLDEGNKANWATLEQDYTYKIEAKG